MKRTFFFCLLLSGRAFHPCYSLSDTGQIHAHDATVRETSQKAIIFHNGTEEILILGTDLQADREMARRAAPATETRRLRPDHLQS